MPEFRQKKSAEQMENSSPNPSFSICDIRIQKRLAECFAKSFPQKIVLPKLRPHCSATLPEYLEGRTPKEKHPFLFQKKFHPRQIKNARSVFLSGLLAYSPACGASVHSFIFRSKKVRANVKIT